MWRLLRFSIVICVSLTGIIILLRQISVTRQSSLQLLLIETCAPPCWSNITPGITSVDQAIPLLYENREIDHVGESVPGDFLEQERKVCWGFTTTFDVTACLKRERGTAGSVSRIDFKISNSALKIGDLFAIYGQPLAVRYIFTGSGMLSSLFFSNNVEAITVKSFDSCKSVWLTAGTPVDAIVYHYVATEPPFEFDTPAWQGFKAIPEISC
jgi:hypothetical protein